jgi:hypothetical protein
VTQPKVFSLVIAAAMIFPFVADHSGLWAAVLGTGQLSTVVLTVYTLTLIVIVASLLIRSTVLGKREKWIWAVALLVAFPFASLALLYRLYWRPPAAVGN